MKIHPFVTEFNDQVHDEADSRFSQLCERGLIPKETDHCYCGLQV
jgi:hypothetical protein